MILFFVPSAVQKDEHSLKVMHPARSMHTRIIMFSRLWLGLEFKSNGQLYRKLFSEMISLAELSNKKADNTTLAYKVNDILSTLLSC